MLTAIMVAASEAVLVVLVIIYGCLYLSERKPFILFWLFSWVMLIIAYGSRFFLLTDENSKIFELLNFLSTLGCYYLLHLGTSEFYDKKASHHWGWAALFLSLAYPAAIFITILKIPVLLLALFLCCSMLARLSIISGRRKNIKGSINKFLSVCFVVWGSVLFIYPFSRIMTFIPLTPVYMAVGMAGLVAAISLQSAYYQAMRDELIVRDQKIGRLLAYDSLTGVFNRAYIEDQLGFLEGSLTYPVSILMGDINGLKLINDTFGHANGDELLCDAADLISDSLRPLDLVARWGGDEFLIFLSGTDTGEADEVINKIKGKCRNFRPKTIPLEISFGIVTLEKRSVSLKESIKTAEDSMYSRKLSESKSIRRYTIGFLEKLLWERDYQTEEHVLRLKTLVKRLGAYLGLSDKEIGELCHVAALHDIGKIAIPSEILNKPGPLTDEEWEIMKKHSEIGYRIAQSSRELSYISEAILGHHEWWNGCGYPQGLMGEEIPYYSRIVSVADSYDVITHNRPYKKAVGEQEAIQELIQCSGTQYDPSIVKCFVEMMLGSSTDSVSEAAAANP